MNLFQHRPLTTCVCMCMCVLLSLSLSLSPVRSFTKYICICCENLLPLSILFVAMRCDHIKWVVSFLTCLFTHTHARQIGLINFLMNYFRTSTHWHCGATAIVFVGWSGRYTFGTPISSTVSSQASHAWTTIWIACGVNGTECDQNPIADAHRLFEWKPNENLSFSLTQNIRFLLKLTY